MWNEWMIDVLIGFTIGINIVLLFILSVLLDIKRKIK